MTEYQSVGRDVTEMKHAENAILEANSKLSLLSSITRHDIQNQLSALLMLEELLKKDITEEQPSAYVDAIIDVTNKIGEQIQFARDYRDLGQVKPAWQSLREVADQAVMQSHACSIRTAIGAEDVFVYADRMLGKVFLNLYDNAIRHGRTITQIRISFQNEGTTGIITVTDDGIRVPTDMKEKTFNHHMSPNTGLGLFLASEILAITKISIRETGVPGKGSVFEMLIPEGKWRRGSEFVPDLKSRNTSSTSLSSGKFRPQPR